MVRDHQAGRESARRGRPADAQSDGDVAVLRCPTPIRSGISTHQTQHDLAEKHVLERLERPRIPVICLCEALKRLEEVRVRRLVVLVVGVDCAGLQVEGGLEEWGAVDRVCGGSCGRESGLGEA